MTTRKYHRGRGIEYLARDYLLDRGYHVIRSAGTQGPVDLVAWGHSRRVLFVQTKRSRRHIGSTHEVVKTFHPDFEDLRLLPRPDQTGVQLWLYQDQMGWRFFDVLPGGVKEVQADA